MASSDFLSTFSKLLVPRKSAENQKKGREQMEKNILFSNFDLITQKNLKFSLLLTLIMSRGGLSFLTRSYEPAAVEVVV